MSACKWYTVTIANSIRYVSSFFEYIPGGSVASCLLKHGRFEENVTKSFTYQILDGLDYLHSKGILHRVRFSLVACRMHSLTPRAGFKSGQYSSGNVRDMQDFWF